MLDRAFTQRPGDTQVGFLQQVFGGAGIVDHTLQRAQQADPLGEEYSVEVGLTHSDTRTMRSE
ncbi:hypothetical protein D3C72_2495310 [compost metagenome]